METQRINFRLPKLDAERFLAAARKSRWNTPSKLLRQMVQQVIGAEMPAPGAEPIAAPTKVPNSAMPSKAMTIRLPAEDLVAAQTIAAAYGGLTAWLRAMVQERIGQAAERPATDEIKALYQATQELWHVGNNLNPVARELHPARLEGQPAPANKVTPELLEKLALAVDAVADRNRAIIVAARKRGNRNG